MLRAVSFDLDDTLCTFTDAERAARRRLIGQVARELALPEAELAAAYRVANNRRLVDAAAGYWIATTQLAHTVACWREALEPFMPATEARVRAPLLARRFLDVRRAALRLYDDALPALLAARARVPLALISNGPRDNQ